MRNFIGYARSNGCIAVLFMSSSHQTDQLKTKAQWLQYIEATHPSEIELGLGRVSVVADRLNIRRPAPVVILVGGTNGKGTTTGLLASLLSAQGLSCGLYNSPHIHEYNERVSLVSSLGHQHISDDALCASFLAIENARDEISLTYFEYGTLAALYQIQRWQVDVALLEVGLGGRLDATNIVDPDLSIVTSIGLDHQDWLGNTLDLIGAEKAGIARNNKPFICGQESAPSGLRHVANEVGSKESYQNEDFSLVASKGLWRFNNGRHQVELDAMNIPHWNVSTVLQALSIMERFPTDAAEVAALKDVISNFNVPGRLQRVTSNYKGFQLEAVLDVAHNPQAAEYVASQIEGNCTVGVLAMLADKDPVAVVKSLTGIREWHLAGLKGDRGLTASELLHRLTENDLQDISFKVHDDIASACDAAMESLCLMSKNSQEDGASIQQFLVLGSFYTVDAAHGHLTK